MALDERKAQILSAVIEEYVKTGLPVGSRAIARRYQLGVSPATIRNEMGDLEDMGYLGKTHTSSGRVPSDKGYRVYVNELMGDVRLSQRESQMLESLFRSKMKDVESLLKEAVKALSEATNYLAFVLGPEYETTTIEAIHLLPVTMDKALLVIVSDIGFVENCLIDVPVMSREEIEYVSQILCEHLCHISLSRVKDKAQSLLKREASRYADIIVQVAEFLDSMTEESESERLYMGGAANLLRQPEFRDPDRVQELMQTLENGSLVKNIMITEPPSRDPAVTIGEENRIETVKEFSFVYGTFRVGSSEGKIGIFGPKRMNCFSQRLTQQGFQGKIGIFGPKRMNYPRVVSVVSFFERNLNEILDITD